MTPKHLVESFGPREAMAFDVVIVGAGLAGLATAIRLKQLNADASIIVLEKGSEPGAHVLSGAILDPRALTELFPDWKERGAPLDQPVTGDDILMLSATGSRRIPDVLVTRNFHNHGCYVVRLGHVVKWLAEQAEALGVEIFPGFAGSELLFGEDGSVRGVATGHVGLGKDGDPKDSFQLGMELTGRYTIFAEGARGHLARQLLERLKLTEDRDPQGYALGVKELWEVPPEKAKPGRVVHTTGWPMGRDVFGGGFLYHLEENLVALGLVIGLDYANPWLSPFDEMQRWKTHPAVRSHTEGGKRLSYGARAINNGMPQALPKFVFPGGALVGCAAGFMNAARIKGSHAAIKSGMLCAEALAEALAAGRSGDELSAYPELFAGSWLADELQQSRNFKLWFKKRPQARPCDDRSRALAPAEDRRQLAALDAAQRQARPCQSEAGCRMPADRVSEARRRADLRPAVFGFPRQRQPRRGPAAAPDAERPDHSCHSQSRPLRRAGAALLPGWRLRVREERRGRRASLDQRAKLRSLQDLRHQGSDAEYRMGGARGRRRPELCGHVSACESTMWMRMPWVKIATRAIAGSFATVAANACRQRRK